MHQRILVAAALVIAVAATGCNGTGSGPSPEMSGGAPDLITGGAPAPLPSAVATPLCHRVPESWARGVMGWPRATVDMNVYPTNSGSASSLFIAQVKSPSFSGIALVTPHGALRRVLRFEDPRQDQLLSASSDGRFYVFSITHSLNGWDDWTLHSYDSIQGRLVTLEIGRAHV